MNTRTIFLSVFLAVLLVSFFAVPYEVSAATRIWQPGTPLVPCGTIIGSNDLPSNPCGFNDLIQLIQNLISFMLWAAAPVSTLLFAYAGFLYMTAGGKGEQVSRAHKIFLNVVVGVIIMLTAWLMVYVITEALLSDDYKTASLLRND